MQQVPRSLAGLETLRSADSQPMPPDFRAAPPLARCTFESCVPVLIATCRGRTSTLLHSGLLASAQASGRMYRVERAELSGIADLAACCRKRTPRLLLVDIALLSQEGMDQVDELHRSNHPTDWLLGWEQPSAQGLDAAIRIQARGCVEWRASAAQFAQSLDAVFAGTLGFPGPVLQALYLSVLRWAAIGGHAASGAALTAVRLTEREDEVLSLMQRDMSNKQIAERLGISVNTVKKHLAHVFAKQGQHSRRWHLARPGVAGPGAQRPMPLLAPASAPSAIDKFGLVALPAYSASMPAAFTIRPHFCDSAVWNLASSSGEVVNTSVPVGS